MEFHVKWNGINLRRCKRSLRLITHQKTNQKSAGSSAFSFVDLFSFSSIPIQQSNEINFTIQLISWSWMERKDELIELACLFCGLVALASGPANNPQNSTSLSSTNSPIVLPRSIDCFTSFSNHKPLGASQPAINQINQFFPLGREELNWFWCDWWALALYEATSSPRNQFHVFVHSSQKHSIMITR